MTSLQTIARKLDGDGAEVTWRDVTLRGSSFQTVKVRPLTVANRGVI